MRIIHNKYPCELYRRLWCGDKEREGGDRFDAPRQKDPLETVKGSWDGRLIARSWSTMLRCWYREKRTVVDVGIVDWRCVHRYD